MCAFSPPAMEYVFREQDQFWTAPSTMLHHSHSRPHNLVIFTD
jgi:hypothetical protein